MSKKNLVWRCLVSLVCVATLQSCIVGTAVELSRDAKKYPVEVVLQDGGTVTGEAKMPNGKTKSVTVKDENGTKTKLRATEIDRLIAWNAKAPDSRFILVYQDKYWRSVEAVGEYIAVFAGGADYYINKKGVMTITGKYISYYGLRPGDNEPTFIIQRSQYGTNKPVRKVYPKYFSDDPDLCNAIEDGKIDPFDFKAICEQYKPEGK